MKRILITCSSGFLGSNNSLNSYELHPQAATLLGLKEPSKWILPDTERFSDQERNLTMHCSLIEKHGILFHNSIQGIISALNHPSYP